MSTVASPPPAARLRSLAGDALGACSATLLALPSALSLGLIAFAILGPAFAAAGVVAAVLAIVIGNLAAALLPAAPGQMMGARSSAVVVFAGSLAVLASHPLLQGAEGPDVPRVLAVAFAIVFVAGALQVVFGLTGLGRAVRFVPHPVIAGFMNGIALVMLLSQLAPALGLDASRPPLETLRDLSGVKPAALLVTFTAVAGMVLARRYVRHVPEALVGLFAGVIVHYALAGVAPGATGPVVGPLPSLEAHSGQWQALLGFPWGDAPGTWLLLVLPHALVLAAVMALDGLLASLVADALTHTQHDSRRLLIGQGIAGMASAVAGAMPAMASTNARVVSVHAGGVGRAAPLLSALFVLLAVLALGPLVAGLPVAALAGMMIYLALSMMDRWTSDLVRRLRADAEHRGEIALNLVVVALVALALVLLNIMAAFVLGVVAAVVVLLAQLSGSPVRRVLDGTVRTSLKVRDDAARAALAAVAHRIRILELEGEIFFGTAEGLRREIEALPADTRIVVLDFRRVHQVDASGVRVLQLTGDQAARRGLQVLLSHVADDDPRGRYFQAMGLSASIGTDVWFRDLDRALEWAEDRLLAQARFQDAPEIAPAQMGFFAGLDAEELRLVGDALERHDYAHGDVVFKEGDPGDRLFLIARGFVSIKVALDDGKRGGGRALRLATLSPGVFFGESAMMEGGRRAGDGFAKGERVVLYSLHADRIAALVRSHPALALKLYRNLTRELLNRVRSTSQALRALE